MIQRNTNFLPQFIGGSKPQRKDTALLAAEIIELRNNISRLLNVKQQELAKLQCEVKRGARARVCVCVCVCVA